MKKLLLVFISLLLFSNIYAQNNANPVFKNQLITTNGVLYSGEITLYDGKKVSIAMGNVTYGIYLQDIAGVRGEIQADMKKSIQTENPAIQFENTLLPADTILPKTRTTGYDKYPNYHPSSYNSLTSGDLIMKSSMLRLSGFTVAGATAIAYYAGAFDKMETKDLNTLFIVSGSVSLVLYIAGEITLFNAGKMHNKDAITLTPASQGIGMAINF